MKSNILLIEYEPRYVDRVTKALEQAGFGVQVAEDVDGAVERCAHFEPDAVIITSVLPRIRLEDAITQLRARAGLRSTPVLVLMSGYRGADPKADAARYGAQDILERPFSGEVLVQRVQALLEAAGASPAATQAIPQEMLDALKRNAGLKEDTQVTSDELFGDILSDVEAEEEGAEEAPAGEETPSQPPHEKTDTGVQRTLEQTLADVLSPEEHRPTRRKPSTETDVDAILSQTLAGLDVQPVRKKAAPPREEAEAKAEPAEPASAKEEAPAQPPATEKAKDRAAPPQVKATPPAAPAGTPPKGKKAEGTQFGQYILMEHIATGGMAEVYKARMMGMEGFQKTVAIKRILPHLTDNDEFVTMFIDEAKLAAQLNHNNIIHIYDLGKIDRSYYIAMEYIEGMDLRSILKLCRERGITVPVPIALHITALLASALDYAHRKRDFENRDLGLVHRDVSPQNVLISGEGDIKLCDFGIAKAASKASHTRAGALKGKLQYMSPEQAWGKDIDHRSDIFSLGLVAYEMLTGEKVFAGDSELTILEQVRNPKVDPPSSKNPDIPPEVDAIVMKALSPDREGRYQSARDLQRDLEKVMRKHGWRPSQADVARFLKELGSGEQISGAVPIAEEGAAAPVEAQAGAGGAPPEEPPQPPGEKPPAEPEPEPAAAEPAAAAPVVMPDAAAAAEAPAEDTFVRRAAEEKKQRTRLLLGLAALVVVAIGLWFLFRPNGTPEGPAAPTPTLVAVAPVAATDVTPTPTEEELLREKVRQKAEELLAQQQAAEEANRPAPTPEPPTPTPTETPTPEPSPTATSTPTPTPRPTATPTPTPIPPTPTPSVVFGELVAPGPDVTPPALIKRVDPKYPPVARQLRYSGEVQLMVLVGPDGSVEKVRILRCTRPGVGFEKAAEEAVKQWRYKPATKKGVKVRMWQRLRIPFQTR